MNYHPPKTSSPSPAPVNHLTDTILCGDAANVLKRLPDNSVDLVVTSPPYDALRNYHGFTLDLHRIGKQLHRVLRYGGVVVMVIQDQTKAGTKTLTSFRTIVDWCDNAGFRLFESLVYQKKHALPGPCWDRRFRVDHEYMPIFVKGQRPAYFDKRHLAVSCKTAGTRHRMKQRSVGGSTGDYGKEYIVAPTKCRGTIWPYANTTSSNDLKRQHPATFSDQLAADFIECFCPKDGIVLDPFVGSGTVPVAAKKLQRHFIGVDISEEYCAIAEARVLKEIN